MITLAEEPSRAFWLALAYEIPGVRVIITAEELGRECRFSIIDDESIVLLLLASTACV